MPRLPTPLQVRSLAVDVVGSAMRESTRGMVESLSEVVRLPSLSPTLGSLPAMYAALALVCVLVAYMLGSAHGSASQLPICHADMV